MKLSRKALDAYNAAIKKQGGAAENAALSALRKWFAENPEATVAETRDFCIALLREIGILYGNAAGDAAYALRSLIAEAGGIELPDVQYSYEPDPEVVDKTARYQAGKLVDGDVDGFSNAIAAAARYFAERGANDTMAALGKADGKKLGRRVRFARIPTGATTCPYCCMLASRGFVYHSEVMALNGNHRNCDCRIVEGFPGMEVEGYDPDEYYRRWKESGEEQPKPEPEPQEPTERQKLEADARKAARNQAAALGISEEESLRRFDLLVDSNTDAQLRKYIKRYG